MDSIALRKVKAGTLVETIVALVIILVVFAIATTIIVQTTEKGASILKLRSNAYLDEYVLRSHRETDLSDEELSSEEFVIRRQVLKYGETNCLMKINYYIYDKHQQLLETRTELIPQTSPI